jgi:hypothetical protein
VDALPKLKQPERVARLRGKSVAEVLGWDEKDKLDKTQPAPTPAAQG